VSRFVVVSDLQCPSHDRKAVTALTAFMAEYRPEGVLIVGDESDQPEPSRWTKGTAEEFGGTLQSGLDVTRGVLERFRDAVGGVPIHLMRSNHGDRIRTYINRYAPALSSLRELAYERLVGLQELGITYHEKPYEYAPRHLLAHCDEGSLVKSPGGTALGLARKWGASVTGGHTHKLGVQHEHQTLGGRVSRELWGCEVGHLMDMKRALYLKAGAANWQQGFGIAYTTKRGAFTVPVPIQGRSFVVEGKTFSW